jgi:broad-specificity NMP kinase
MLPQIQTLLEGVEAIMLVGIPGSGKSTIAHKLEEQGYGAWFSTGFFTCGSCYREPRCAEV